MIQSAVTVSLVEEAKGGPFVFWNGLDAAFEVAADLEFDAVEVFAPGPDAVDPSHLKDLCEQHGLSVAAVGTGAGMVIHGLSLTDPSESKRDEAKAFVRSMIDFGGPFGAPAIIGSMQGRFGNGLDHSAALNLLGDAVNELGKYAEEYGIPLIYEPLNRYETNLINTIEDGVEFLEGLENENVGLLADLFHMNIEEANVAEALSEGIAAGFVEHIHFVDSNRKAAGMGHFDLETIAEAIRNSDYSGYLSVEAFPKPDSFTAASKTIESFRRFFRDQ